MAKKRPFARTDRLASQIREVVAKTLMLGTREEILRGIVVTDVEVSRDVAVARVFWHTLPGMAVAVDRKAIEAALGRAQGFIRAKVGEVITARVTPELRFEYDEAVDYGRRIEAVLSTLEIPPAPPEEDDDSEDEGADLDEDDASEDSDFEDDSEDGGLDLGDDDADLDGGFDGDFGADDT